MSAVTVDQPGVYDLDAETYHADPVPDGSLSQSGAKRLLPPSCPALFRHWADTAQAHKQVYDLGRAAHGLVLGIGDPLVVIDADDYRTRAAREARDAAYTDGATPLLSVEHDQVQAMAAALRAHPVAGDLLAPGRGRAEQSLFWIDEETGVWRRAMLDWLTETTYGLPLVVDYKTCASAEPGAVSGAVAKFGYLQQDPWYLDGVEACGLAPHGAAFVFVFQEKTPPHLITICQLSPEAREWGRRLNRKALDTYRRCRDAGHWPGYADEVISVDIPGWADRQYQAAWERGDLDPIALQEAIA